MTMEKERVIIIGAGPHGRVIADILRHDTTKEVVGYLDRDGFLIGEYIDGLPVLGDDSYLEDVGKRETFDSVIIGLGGNRMVQRTALHEKIKSLGLKTAKAIHPRSTVSALTDIGNGTVVMAGAVINAGTVIQENCVVNTGAIVDHDCMIEEGSFIQPGAVLAGDVHVGRYAIVAMGAKVLERRKIAQNSIVGAGAVVTKDVPSNVVVTGIPARKHRDHGVRA